MPSPVLNAASAEIGAPFDTERSALAARDSRLAALIVEHDDLDAAISVLLDAGNPDDLLITRLKKRKLQVKDEIALVSRRSAFRATA